MRTVHQSPCIMRMHKCYPNYLSLTVDMHQIHSLLQQNFLT